jgi:hypothetical protein
MRGCKVGSPGGSTPLRLELEEKGKSVPMTNAIVSDSKYIHALRDVVSMLEKSRHAASRNINALMTATYWHIGRRIVEFEQGGADRAAYGQALLQRLSADLTAPFGRGFGADRLELMRLFYQDYNDGEISEAAIR